MVDKEELFAVIYGCIDWDIALQHIVKIFKILMGIFSIFLIANDYEFPEYHPCVSHLPIDPVRYDDYAKNSHSEF
jgi:hypothetical protein